MEFDSFVLAASTADLGEEPRAREYADAVEFRLDLAAADGVDPLEHLRSYDGQLPVIATNRPAWEGGEADDEGRLATLSEAIELDPVEAVDVELASAVRGEADDLIERAREVGVSVVASVHDFKGTPPEAELRDLLDAAADHGDVAKLAVTARHAGHVLTVLSLTREYASDGHRVATMAMGEVGRHSRAIAPIYGSRIGYAPVDSRDATAPGQFDLETLAELIERLE